MPTLTEILLVLVASGFFSLYAYSEAKRLDSDSPGVAGVSVFVLGIVFAPIMLPAFLPMYVYSEAKKAGSDSPVVAGVVVFVFEVALLSIMYALDITIPIFLLVSVLFSVYLYSAAKNYGSDSPVVVGVVAFVAGVGLTFALGLVVTLLVVLVSLVGLHAVERDPAPA